MNLAVRLPGMDELGHRDVTETKAQLRRDLVNGTSLIIAFC